ncbi:MAG TPA: hypothetical protein PKE55_07580 [Kiritimatiellia bacterium]|nr:hypothetical protein [Kiritimatiellia bacterium]
MKTKKFQYTLRNIPPRVDQCLRERSARYRSSLNAVAVQALSQGLGLEDEPPVYHDLDDLVGTWVNDPAFDQAMEAQDAVDEELWQ